MSVEELMKSGEELKEIAGRLYDEIKRGSDLTVSRYTHIADDYVRFVNGKTGMERIVGSDLNKENMTQGVYTRAYFADLQAESFDEATVCRDLQERRFKFPHKGLELPSEETVFIEAIPTNVAMYDDELRDFTRLHRNTIVGRSFIVEQKVVVNSRGGIAIQSIPFVEIRYDHGFAPLPVSRGISAVCASTDDVKKLVGMIKYLADPTQDKRIKNSPTFTDAFHELHKISALRYGSLEDAGIPLSGLYDAVVLTGVPAHEVFGHHFEEPMGFINFGDSGTFKYGQDIGNKDIVLMDNPEQMIEGLRVRGFTFFDAYGRGRPARTHIKDGKVVEFLGGEYADQSKLKKYMNLEASGFVGNSSQYKDGHFPQPRMSCTVLDGRTEKIDLEGKILLVSHSGHTLNSDKTYVVEAQECYVMRGGVPLRVVPLKVTGGINQALANITLLEDLSYNTGFCGKSEPIDYRGEARVPVSQYSRSQLWRGQQLYPLEISDPHLKILTK